MGDGRYFTYYQFIQILYFTFAISCLVSFIMFIWIKAKKRENINYIIFALMSWFLLLTLIFITEVSYGIKAVNVLWHIQSGLVFIIIIWNIDDYLKQSGLVRVLRLILYLPLCSFPFWIPSLWFKVEKYSLFFILLIFTCLIVLGALAQKDIGQYKKETERYKWYESRMKALALMVFATSFQLYIILPRLRWIFLLSILLAACMYMYIFLNYLPQQKIPYGYYRSMEHLFETFIVISHERQVLYTSKTEFSTNIEANGRVDLRHLEDLIHLDRKSVIKLSSKLVQVNGYKGHDLVSCRLSFEKVISKKMVIGYVVLIEDCTHLEHTIVELKEKKTRLAKTEADLLALSKTAKVLGEETERNRLLIDVQNELGHHLATMTKYLARIVNQIEEEEPVDQVLEALEEGISLAKANLSNIRQTVRIYRESFDGKR